MLSFGGILDFYSSSTDHPYRRIATKKRTVTDKNWFKYHIDLPNVTEDYLKNQNLCKLAMKKKTFYLLYWHCSNYKHMCFVKHFLHP